MQIFESARVSVEDDKFVVIRVPNTVLESLMKSGYVMARAEHDFGCPVVLLGAESGRTLGSPGHRERLARFDPAAALWSQWNMLEEDSPPPPKR
jgi:hypothetical protein